MLEIVISEQSVKTSIQIGDHRVIPDLRRVIISDEQVASIYGKQLQKQLGAELLTFPSGEQNKTREMKAILEDQLHALGCGRDTCLIALGGGVVTDLVGFIAATYCRGIPLVLIPTSLMAMVDASIGGKTAVNTAAGKNLVGAIYHPSSILIEPAYLLSLPEREFRSGLSEVIKHGLIADRKLFEFLEENLDLILQRDLEILKELIYRNILIKKSVVEADINENGLRRILNFGHTVGHAIEQISGYKISHGEAVALGMIREAEFSEMESSEFERIRCLIRRCFPDLEYPKNYNDEELFKIMALDKKSVNGIPRFVMLEKIGAVKAFNGHYCSTVGN